MILGKRVRIRPIEPEDLGALKDVNDDPVVRGNVVGWGWPVSLHDQKSWYEGNRSDLTQRWTIEDTEGVVVGMTGLWDVDLRNRNAISGLKLGRESRGRGLGTDAIMAVMAFAFYDVGLQRLYATIIEDNGASRAAYCDRCGWSVEGTSRRHVWRGGAFRNLLHVGILKEEFDALPDSASYVGLLGVPDW